MTKILIALIVWMVISFLLVGTIVGLLLFLPGANYTEYYKPISERRSTWCTIGVRLINKLLND